MADCVVIENELDEVDWFRPDLVQDDPPFGALQFTVNEVQSVLLELDTASHSEEMCIRFCASTFSSLKI
jgi:hypothetical protein